jgi:hypothetical protein
MTTAHTHNHKVCTCKISSTRHDPPFTKTVPYRSRSWNKEILRGIVFSQRDHRPSLLSASPTNHQPFDLEVFAVLHPVYEDIKAWNDSNGHVRYILMASSVVTSDVSSESCLLLYQCSCNHDRKALYRYFRFTISGSRMMASLCR